MRGIIKIFRVAATMAMTAAFMVSCGNSKGAETGSAEAARQLMKEIKGTYIELFSENTLLNGRWDSLWVDECAKAVGKESAQATASMLKSSMSGDLTGEAATQRFGDGSDGWKNGFQFNCDFQGGVEKFVIDGKGHIKGLDSAGNEVFSHKYAFANYNKELDFTIFKSEDSNNDEFTYFAFRSDTPATTHHIEFRYGTDPESLNMFCTGKYAYWMAAGVLEGNESEQAESIRLFVTENTSQEN